MSESPTGNFKVGDVAGDVSIQQAGGDIIAGNKTVINQIIQQVAQQLIGAPYKFLAAYDISDRDIFFGRKAITEELASKVPRYKVLIINGASGSGKSSLINAGLIPRLAENDYSYLSFRDYHNPLQQLREYAPERVGDDTNSLLSLIQNCCDDDKDQRIVIMLDQFERFFVNVPMAQREQFIQAFQETLAQTTADNMNFVIILRHEFFGQLVTEFDALIPDFLQQAAHFNLQPLSLAEAREAIIQPLARLDVKIVYDEQFVDEILLTGLTAQSKQGEQPRIEPAQLQIVCNALYEVAREQLISQQKSAVIINQALCNELGGPGQILATYLEKTIAEIAVIKQDHAVIRSMLKTMIDSSGTRRFVSLSALQAALPDVPATQVINLLENLSERRVVEQRLHGYSLSHEIMVAEVRSWFDEREMMRQQAQETLTRGLAEWRASKSLLSTQQLKKIGHWLPDLSQEAQQLLSLSRSLHSRQRQLRRSAKAIGVLLIAMVVILGIFSHFQAEEARQQKVEAERQSDIAQQQREKAEQAQMEAMRQRNQALETQSLFLADLASQQTVKGNATNGLALALAALPPTEELVDITKTDFSRPYLPQAMEQLYNATVYPRERFILSGHQKTINQLAFNHDASQLASVSDDGSVRLWAVASGELLRQLAGHAVEARTVAFSPDGQWLVSGGADGVVKIWTVATGELHSSWQAHDGVLSDVRFNDIGTRLVTHAQAAKQLTVWTVADQQPLLSLSLAEHNVLPMTTDPSAEFIMGLRTQDTVIWSVAERREHKRLRGHQAKVTQAHWSADGQFIVTLGSKRRALLWQATDGKLLHTFRLNNNAQQALFSPNSQRLILLTSHYQVYSCDLTAFRCIKPWSLYMHNYDTDTQRPPADLLPLNISSDGQWLISLGHMQYMNIWATHTSNRLFSLTAHGNKDIVNQAVFSPDKQWLASASSDQRIRLWRVYGDTQQRKLISSNDKIHHVAWQADGQRLATASDDGMVDVWSVADSRLLYRLPAHQDSVRKVMFNPQQPQLLSISTDTTARLWDLNTGRSQATLTGHQEPLRDAAYSADGKQLATVAKDARARLYQADSGALRFELVGHNRAINTVAFNPAGNYVATGADDTTIRLWDTTTGTVHSVLRGHSDDVRQVVFSQDGQRLASVAEDGTARIWQVNEGRNLLVLEDRTIVQQVSKRVLLAVQFIAQDSQLVTAGNDSRLQLWDSESGELLGSLKGYNRPVRHLHAMGNILLAVAEDGARVWNMQLPPVRRGLANLQGDVNNAVSFAALSPDARWIALSSTNNVLYLYPFMKGGDKVVQQALITQARELTHQQRKWFFLEAE